MIKLYNLFVCVVCIVSYSNMFSRFNRLPDEIITNIFEYIPPDTLTWLSKTYYDKYHATTIQTHIKNTGKKIDSFFRYIIRLDNHVALQDMLNNSQIIKDIKAYNDNHKQNHNHNHNHKIKYKNKKYANIIYFLLYLSRETERPATKCKNILIEYVKK